MEELFQTVRIEAPGSNGERREDSLWGFALDLVAPLLSIGVGSMLITYGLLS